MFYGREEELSELDSLWRKNTASMVTCRGRRRIGKSTMIEEFARRSKAHFIEIMGTAPGKGIGNRQQLENFSIQLMPHIHGHKKTVPLDWLNAFMLLDAAIGNEKTVILLDEISWMGQYDATFPGHLKTAWDMYLKKHPRLILVLCGSVSTWIQENILNNTGFVGRSSLNLTLRELPLSVCRHFWGTAAERIAPGEIIDVLSITGGVPRYLEEIDPALSANENIRRMCFRPKALLRDDFAKIFNSVFGENAIYKRNILAALSVGPLTLAELAEKLHLSKGGSISQNISELLTAGFISGDAGLNPLTGKPAKSIIYRLSDNYTRFYLKYIQPNEAVIDRDGFRFLNIEALPAWETILGLQFENLVMNNIMELLPRLGLQNVLIKSAAPWRQLAGARKKGCQIDMLIQAERMVYVIEMKRRKYIGSEVADEVAAKIEALSLPRSISVRTALVYEGELHPAIAAEGFFDALVSIGDLMHG